MMILNSHKSKQFLVVLIKLSIVVGAFYVVYNKLASNGELKLHEFITLLHKNELFSVKNVLFLIILTILNWFFEILKWKNLVSSVTSISLKNASEQSLGALTASLLTPNRVGEYGAKAIYYQKSLRKKIMLLNLIGNMLQMSTTIIFGSIGLLCFVIRYSLELNVVKLSIFFLIVISILSTVIYLFRKNQFKIKGFSLERIQDFVLGISFRVKMKAFLFSAIRYLIFSFQFYVFLQIFDVNIDYFTAMMVITTMYLLSSIVPSIFIFDVVIKGSVAVYLFSMLGVHDLTVLCIVTLMWLMNFVIPSVFGSYYVLNFNLPKVDDTL
jgi:hypothetical protein